MSEHILEQLSKFVRKFEEIDERLKGQLTVASSPPSSPSSAIATLWLHLSLSSIQMLPSARNKVDLTKLNAEDRKALEKYGKLPPHKGLNALMQRNRKYFDSGDYALSKAGHAPQSVVGTAIPNPENIPHASSPGNGHSGHQIISISPTNSTSPVNKESGLANNENTIVPEERLPGSGEESQIAGEETHTSSLGNGRNNAHQIIFISPTSPLNKESGLVNNENTIVPEERSKVPEEQSPESGEEPVTVDEKTQTT